MESKGNVIDFSAFKNGRDLSRPQQEPKGLHEEITGPSGPVIGIDEHKKDALGAERRSVKRTMLSEFVGAFIVIPQLGLQEVCLFDISEGGVSFDLEIKHGQFKVGEEIATRFYLSQNNYFTFNIQITNVRMLDDEGVFRHGTKIIRENHNYEAIDYFIKFVESFTRIVKVDRGDLRAPSNRR